MARLLDLLDTMTYPISRTNPTLRSRYLLALAPAAVDALALPAWQERARLRAILQGEAGPTAAAALQSTLDHTKTGCTAPGCNGPVGCGCRITFRS